MTEYAGEKIEEKTMKELMNYMKSEFACFLCGEIFIKPVRTDCGHTFCEYCIRTWFSSSEFCPTCFGYPKYFTKAIGAEKFIENLMIRMNPEIQMERRRILAKDESLLQDLCDERRKFEKKAGRNSEESTERPLLDSAHHQYSKTSETESNEPHDESRSDETNCEARSKEPCPEARNMQFHHETSDSDRLYNAKASNNERFDNNSYAAQCYHFAGWRDNYNINAGKRKRWYDEKGYKHWYDSKGYEHWYCGDRCDHWLDGKGHEHWYDIRGYEHCHIDDGREYWLDRNGGEHWYYFYNGNSSYNWYDDKGHQHWYRDHLSDRRYCCRSHGYRYNYECHSSCNSERSFYTFEVRNRTYSHVHGNFANWNNHPQEMSNDNSCEQLNRNSNPGCSQYPRSGYNARSCESLPRSLSEILLVDKEIASTSTAHDEVKTDTVHDNANTVIIQGNAHNAEENAKCATVQDDVMTETVQTNVSTGLSCKDVDNANVGKVVNNSILQNNANAVVREEDVNLAIARDEVNACTVRENVNTVIAEDDKNTTISQKDVPTVIIQKKQNKRRKRRK